MVVDEPDLPWKDENEGKHAVAGALTPPLPGQTTDAARVSGLLTHLTTEK